MDYLYEKLGDERFQELCQALLLKDHPTMQCFPVGQPDGGRDALSYTFHRGGTKDFIVFQVKYVKNPQMITEPHKWLLDIISDEAPKIARLIPKGAKAYRLVTNVPGTAHLGTGSIDKCNSVLEQYISIPSICLWRDDLNRRMDNSYDLKWAYPDVMGGTDILRLVIESGLVEHKERRVAAIRTFLRAQYDEDKEVRFKQVELQDTLIDLFVDVPIGRRVDIVSSHMYNKQHQMAVFVDRERLANEEESESIGAAKTILSPQFQHRYPQIILEGAPGQGKSTLAQYICQIYRMSILGDNEHLSTLPQEHKPLSVRLPFRIDLRDLATWSSKHDPFSSDENKEVPADWRNSLESFMVEQIRHFSGGAEFSITDLHMVLKLTSIIIILDGLDEIAELSKRKDVITTVVSGVHRLREVTASLQVMVTSRPTALEASVDFPVDEYHHFQLLSLTKPLILEYSKKWIASRRLEQRDAASVRRVLKDKIEHPHLRELTRNPMQLAILLSLIHSRGESLPEKRTALYDKYVELFFNRESEKSAVVRDNRDVLIDIHRYLAWVLHSEAEQGGHRGSINSERLQKVISEYLEYEGRPAFLVQELFSGMVERIVFLVSRVEGTYEFEVQPLREYFAARHLYDTAPYSPTGDEKKGTKPDRFDVICKNPYWLNVTRFFAGCYSKGELPSLLTRLKVLSGDAWYMRTTLPRRLAATLLSDWVFSQDQLSTNESVNFIIDGISLRRPYARRRNRVLSYQDDTISLPTNCGREQIVSKCISILHSFPPEDYAVEIARLLQIHGSKDEIDEFWKKGLYDNSGEKLRQWLLYGLYTGALPRCDDITLKEKFVDIELDSSMIEILLNADKYELVQTKIYYINIALNSLLNGTISLRGAADPISALSTMLDPATYAIAFHNPSPTPMSELQRSYSRYPHLYIRDLPTRRIENGCQQSKIIINGLLNFEELWKCNVSDWLSDISIWESLVEEARSLWGDQPLIDCLANMSAAMRVSSIQNISDYSNIFSAQQSLCKRLAYSRSRTNTPSWWKQYLHEPLRPEQRRLLVLAVATWANMNSITKNFEKINDLVTSLSEHEWELIIYNAELVRGLIKNTRRKSIHIHNLPNRIHPRMIVLLALHSNDDDRLSLYSKYLTSYEGIDRPVLDFCENVLFQNAYKHENFWDIVIDIIARRYSMNIQRDSYLQYFHHTFFSSPLPLRIAEKITDKPDKYPRWLSALAAERCEDVLNSSITPVGEIANSEGWFER